MSSGVQLHRLPRFERFQSVTSCTIPRSISQSDSIGNNCCLTNSVLYPSLSAAVLSCKYRSYQYHIYQIIWERESSAAAALLCCPLLCSACALCSLCCELRAGLLCSLCTPGDYPRVLTLFILCSSIFSSLPQAPVNCWTDFFSFFTVDSSHFLGCQNQNQFFRCVCVGVFEFAKIPLSVQESEGGTHRGHPFCPEVDGRLKGVQLVLHWNIF